MEQPHHYAGPQMSVEKWIQKRCTKQDFEFLNMDIGSARETEQLLGKIPEQDRVRALALFLFYKYSDFNLDKPYIGQFRQNTESLLRELRKLANGN